MRMTEDAKKKLGKKKTKANRKTVNVRDIDRHTMGRSLGFPREKNVRLKYSDYISMLGGTGSMGKYYYGANTLYDPDITTTGHQPYCWDQWIALYNHAYVRSSVIKITGYNTGGTIAVIGVYLSDDSTVYSDWTTFSESNRGTMKVMPYQTNQEKPAVVTAKFNHSSFFKGRPNGGAEFLNTVSANNSELAVYSIYLQDSQRAGDAGFKGIIEVVYDVVFTEPKDLAAS